MADAAGVPARRLTRDVVPGTVAGRAVRPRRVQPPGDADSGVGEDPPLHVCRGLPRPDQDDAERPAALGDVEEDLLDRAVALARRVLLAAITRDYPGPASPAVRQL